MKTVRRDFIIELFVCAVLIVFGFYMMVNGYKKVAIHMESGKKQPIVTNFKYADKVIKKKLLTAKPRIDTGKLKIDQRQFDKIYSTTFPIVIELSDVTFGQDIDGHLTEGKTKSYLRVNYDTATNEYLLYATFNNMPKLRGGYYYEGWLVKKEPFDIISTGQIVTIDQEFSNVYASSKNFMDHNFYIVTLEHNDGNSLAEIEILEGSFKQP